MKTVDQKLEVYGEDIVVDGPTEGPRIGCLFPGQNAIIWGRGIHLVLARAFEAQYNQSHELTGAASLRIADLDGYGYLPLILDRGNVLIRPDVPDLLLTAEALLRGHYGEAFAPQIKILHAADERIHDLIEDAGMLWRIAQKSTKTQDIIADISAWRRPSLTPGLVDNLYYYNLVIGVRYITFQVFESLGRLPAEALWQVLREIQTFSASRNKDGCSEVAFFGANGTFNADLLRPYDFKSMTDEELRRTHGQLADRFRQATPAQYWADNPANDYWRNEMYTLLTSSTQGTGDADSVNEEQMIGLDPAFYRKVIWLPGGSILPNGQFLPDPARDVIAKEPREGRPAPRKGGLVFEIISNYLNRHQRGEVRAINVGRITEGLAQPEDKPGRREQYVVAVRLRIPGQAGKLRRDIQIVKVLKWGVLKYLEDGRSLHTDRIDLGTFTIDANEYALFVRDRIHGFRELGGNLVPFDRDVVAESCELAAFRHVQVLTHIIERPYFHGRATQNLEERELRNPAFARKFFALMGRAAAYDMCAGRKDEHNRVIFDTGSEVCMFNADGTLDDIIVTQIIGLFNDLQGDLSRLGESYARPINKRLRQLANADEVSEVYLEALLQELKVLKVAMQENCAGYREGFFASRPIGSGTFKDKWVACVERIMRCDPEAVVNAVRKCLPIGYGRGESKSP